MSIGKSVGGFELATWGGSPIKEVGERAGKRTLSESDCHFGMNGELKGYNFSHRPGVGPRGIDVSRRGGIVAEDLWEAFKKNKDYGDVLYNKGSRDFLPEELQNFLKSFDKVGSEAKINSLTYKAGAQITKTGGATESVEGAQKYYDKDGGKVLSNIALDNDKEKTASQLGARWSKVALERTIETGGKIHFHLDGMGDIQKITNNESIIYSHNVTSRELRYVYKRWSISKWSSNTIFYNGFSKDDWPVEVQCPRKQT